MMKLEIFHIGKKIENQWLWKDISFEVDRGASLVIEGPTGSGKTLLLRCLAFLDMPTEGSIVADQKPITQWNPWEYRSKVILVTQKPIFFQETVEEELQMPFRFFFHGQKKYSQTQILSYLFSLDQQERFLQKKIENLSGGERQILSCLRALQLNPEILILDEPTASLDKEGAEKLMNLVENWLQENQKALIFTSHRIQERKKYGTVQISLR